MKVRVELAVEGQTQNRAQTGLLDRQATSNCQSKNRHRVDQPLSSELREWWMSCQKLGNAGMQGGPACVEFHWNRLNRAREIVSRVAGFQSSVAFWVGTWNPTMQQWSESMGNNKPTNFQQPMVNPRNNKNLPKVHEKARMEMTTSLV